MDKVCLFYQPCGLGDCLFLLKAARHFHNQGYQIYWPVVHEYSWLNEYVPWINWISWGDSERKLTHMDKLPDNIQFPYKERYDPYAASFFSEQFIFINGFANPNGAPVMRFKYDSLGLDYSDWADYVAWDRNKEKEDKLFYEEYGLKEGEDFVFTNRLYQMRPNILFFDRISVDPEKYGKKVVDLKMVPGYSVFDYYKIISEASSIHMIETSFNFIMEAPQMRNNLPKDLNLYSRHGSFWQVDYLFKLPWNYIT